MNGEGYVLRNLLINEAFGEELTWMHDNTSPHMTLESLLEQERREMVPIHLPACSADLNLIEEIWLIMKQDIKAYENRPRIIQELHDALAVQWAKITHEEILALTDTMPEQCTAIKAANGGPTKH
jgi:hypothetical protein